MLSRPQKIKNTISLLTNRQLLIEGLLARGFITEDGYAFEHDRIKIVFQRSEGGNFLQMRIRDGEVTKFNGAYSCQVILNMVHIQMELIADQKAKFQAVAYEVAARLEANGVRLKPLWTEQKTGDQYHRQWHNWYNGWSVNFQAKAYTECRSLFSIWQSGPVMRCCVDDDEPEVADADEIMRFVTTAQDDFDPDSAIYEKRMIYTALYPHKFSHLICKYGLLSIKAVEVEMVGRCENDPVANELFAKKVQKRKYQAIKLRHPMQVEVVA